MNETNRKKSRPITLTLLVLLGLLLVSTVSTATEDEYLIQKLNLNLANAQDRVAYSSVIASEHVISLAAGTPAAPIKHITNMVQHNGYLYVAAENWLLKLNAASLAIEQSVRFGPLYDSAWCRYDPHEECMDSPKVLTNNYNKLLLVYERKRGLLSCWSARQGVCELRDLNNIETVLESSPTPTVASDPFNSTVGFIASAANSQDLLYVAATYNDQGPYRRVVPALAGRSLNLKSDTHLYSYSSYRRQKFMDVLSSSQGLKSSKASIEFISRYQDNFLVKYVDAFNLGIYNFFLTVQHMDIPKNGILSTKLARLCLNDLSFAKSYTEIPLKCTGHGIQKSSGSGSSQYSLIEYNELVAARLVRVKSWSHQEEKSEYHIVGLFQESSRSNFNASLNTDPTREAIKQAVCIFPMHHVQSTIKQNLKRCYNSYDGEPVMRGLSFIKPDQRCNAKNARLPVYGSDMFRPRQESERDLLFGDNFCSSTDNGIYPIGGQIPSVAKAAIEFDTEIQSEYFNSLNVWSDQTATSLVLMSDKLKQLQLFHLKSIDQANHYRTIRLSGDRVGSSPSPAKANLNFEGNGPNMPPSLFVSSDSNVYKLKMSSCYAYTTCNECLMASDPYCGWCSTNSQCTASHECLATEPMTSSGTNSTWINGAKLARSPGNGDQFSSMCVDVKSIDPTISTLSSQTEWIQVNFRKNLPPIAKSAGSSQNSSDYQCVFVDAMDNLLNTDAFQITASKLKCSVPHFSKLRQIFNERLDNGKYLNQNLSVGEDGIFQVSYDGAYYYEETKDSIVLPLYVQSVQNEHVKYGTVSTSNTTAFNLTVVDCQVRRSCVSCANSDGQCSWCVNKCVSQSSELSQSATCVTKQDVCPSFDTGTSKLLIPYTSHRNQAPLTFSLQNQNAELPRYDLACMLTIFDGRFIGKNITMPYRALNTSHAKCILTEVFTELDSLLEPRGQVQTNLRLYNQRTDSFIDSSLNGRLALMFYKCEVKANDCGQCLSLNRQFSCMWCNAGDFSRGKSSDSSGQQSTCRFMNSQSPQVEAAQCISAVSTFFSAVHNKQSKIGFNQCDKPQIKSIEPTKLPIGGGTELVITGVNLGSSLADLDSISIQCGADNERLNSHKLTSHSETLSSETLCDLLPDRYIPSKRIVCHTRPSTSGVQRNCKLNLRLKSRLITAENDPAAEMNKLMKILISNNQVIEYVEPSVSDIEPSIVYKSAKLVWLTIRGTDLDAGRISKISLIDLGTNVPYPNRVNIERDLDRRQVVSCDIKDNTKVTSTEIKCRLTQNFNSLGSRMMKIHFDENMTITARPNLLISTNPGINSIDRQLSTYSGGIKFRLNGLNFTPAQSIYTFIVFRDMWYSAPTMPRRRVSNEVIEFTFPPLNDVFFNLVRSTIKQEKNQGFEALATRFNSDSAQNYELQIGFIMDGFNKTLKNTPVTYIPDFAPGMITIRDIDIAMKQSNPVTTNSAGHQEFSLIIDLDLDRSLGGLRELLVKSELSFYVACSECKNLKWLNETRVSCQLPQIAVADVTTMEGGCERKVIYNVKKNLEKDSLQLINGFIGEYLIPRVKEGELNKNLDVYMQTFALNNIENFKQFADAVLLNMTILKGNKVSRDRLISMIDPTVLKQRSDESVATQNLFLIASVIATLLVLLIVFTLVLVTIIMRMKRKCKQLSSGGGISMKLSYKATNSKVGKKLRQHMEKCQQQIDQMEVAIRPKCAQLFQQLHHDYLNELNHELIYTLGLPVWNYKTYLVNMLFPSTNQSGSSLLIEANPKSGQTNMTCSSMSNSTTNSLLSSTLTPKQHQQQQASSNGTMSVYATIKSNNMLMQLNENSCLQTASPIGNHNQGQYSPNVTEAMQLFDQLLHNKSFLLTFIQVCDSSRAFASKDRCQMASLLTLGLRNNLPYFYSIIKMLLSEFLANSLDNKSNVTKTGSNLFRGNESIVEPLLTNWIGMFMHDFQKDTQCATHLYRLSKAVKFYLDMAPCDQQTQQGVHSLSEDKLLKDSVQFATIYVNVVNQCHMNNPTGTNSNQNANPIQICRVLDMDTVQQAKEKILDYLYKHSSALRPASAQVDLELCLILLNNASMDTGTLNGNTLNKQQTTTTLVTLKETEEELIGTANMNTVDLQLPKRLLTLKDYNIQNGSFINLTFKQTFIQQQQGQSRDSQHVYMSTLSMTNEYQIYAAGERNKSPNPPQLPAVFTANRYHLVKPQQSTYESSSATSSASTSESHISSLSSSDTNSKKRSTKDKKSKSKQYEKLLTVKSRDSAATGTTTTTSLLLNDTASQSTSNYVNNSVTPSPLARLLINKGTIQPFVDQFMESLFMNTTNLPPVVQHLFEFFDQEAKKYQHHFMASKSPQDEVKNLTRSWKTNTYFIRYWANLVKNPDFIVECQKTPLIDSSLNCIAQAFVDSCSNKDLSDLDMHTPISRLLFMRDAPKYTEMIDNFFDEMSSYQSISDHELHFYLNEFTKFQQHTQPSQQLGATMINGAQPISNAKDINPIQTLLQLYEVYEKFEQPINALLGQQQCSVLLPVHHRLVQIKELLTNQVQSTMGMVTMNRSNNNQQQPYSQQTLNPYQQPVNCYATSSELTNFMFSTNPNNQQ